MLQPVHAPLHERDILIMTLNNILWCLLLTSCSVGMGTGSRSPAEPQGQPGSSADAIPAQEAHQSRVKLKQRLAGCLGPPAHTRTTIDLDSRQPVSNPVAPTIDPAAVSACFEKAERIPGEPRWCASFNFELPGERAAGRWTDADARHVATQFIGNVRVPEPGSMATMSPIQLRELRRQITTDRRRLLDPNHAHVLRPYSAACVPEVMHAVEDKVKSLDAALSEIDRKLGARR